MVNVLQAFGTLFILISITTLIIGLIRHFFSVVDTMIPDTFKPYLSVQYAVYYLAVGGVLVLAGQI